MPKKTSKAIAPPAESNGGAITEQQRPAISLDKLRAHAGTLASIYHLLPVQSVVANGTTELISPPANNVVMARRFIEALYADLNEAIEAVEAQSLEQSGANGTDEARPAEHPERGPDRTFN